MNGKYYEIPIRETQFKEGTISLSAESPEEALGKVKNLIENGLAQFNTELDDTSELTEVEITGDPMEVE